MSGIVSGNFPFQTSTQDAYSNYENPAFRIRIRDIRDTGLPAIDAQNDVDYSDKIDIGEIVVGQKYRGGKHTQKLHKGRVEKVVTDDRGNMSIVIIRTHTNEKVELDPQTVVKVSDGSQPTDMDLLNQHDNFFVPGPSKEMSEPRSIMAESDTRYKVKSFLEFTNGM